MVLVVKNLSANAGDIGETGSGQSLVWKDSLEEGMATHPGQRSLVGYSPWGHKESDTTEVQHR